MADKQNVELERLKKENETLRKEKNKEDQNQELARMRIENEELRRRQDNTDIQLKQIIDLLMNKKEKNEEEKPPVATLPFTPPPPTFAFQTQSLGATSGVNASSSSLFGDIQTSIEKGKEKSLEVSIPKDPDQENSKEGEGGELRQKYEMLSNRLKAVESTDVFDGFSLNSLSLVPDLELPPKFKMPDFEKYSGNGCPKNHLIQYDRKMSGYRKNNDLMIHCFQNSLSGSAFRWYNQLESGKVKTWENLAQAFLKQYRHMADEAPDRSTLIGMSMKTNESFKDYAHRWRDIATQISPPLGEKEGTNLFLGTLREPYYEKLVISASRSFAELIHTGELIEGGIKTGRMEGKKSQTLKKKEGSSNEVSAISLPRPVFPQYYPPPYAYPFPPEINNITPNPYQLRPTTMPQMRSALRAEVRPNQPLYNQNPTNTNNFSNQRQYRPRTTFDPIPMTYTELLPMLYENHLLCPTYKEPLQPPYPKWYDPKVVCGYHEGFRGHTTEDCPALKHQVQNLIKSGKFKFGGQEGANTNQNPLPNHQNPAANAIDVEGKKKVKGSVEDVTTPLKIVFEALLKAKMIEPIFEGEFEKKDCEHYNCVYHPKANDHDIQIYILKKLFIDLCREEKEEEIIKCIRKRKEVR